MTKRLRALPPGGRIGIVAPAGPVSPERLDASLNSLRREGFEVVAAPSAFARHGLFAAPDDVRLRELAEMFQRPDIDAVFCTRGGVGSGRLLPRLNVRQIAGSGKPFLGFSDVTAIQWYLWTSENCVSFSGPLAVEWEGALDDRSRRRALQMLAGAAPPDLLNGFPCDGVRLLHGPARAAGILLAGNLTMITTLLGTPFLPDLNGAVLLIEEINEPPYRVDRMLTHLRNAGALDQIAALLAGDFGADLSAEEQTQIDASLVDAVAGIQIPVAAGLPYGHGPVRMTLPIGARVVFNATAPSLEMAESVWEAPA